MNLPEIIYDAFTRTMVILYCIWTVASVIDIINIIRGKNFKSGSSIAWIVVHFVLAFTLWIIYTVEHVN